MTDSYFVTCSRNKGFANLVVLISGSGQDSKVPVKWFYFPAYLSFNCVP